MSADSSQKSLRKSMKQTSVDTCIPQNVTVTEHKNVGARRDSNASNGSQNSKKPASLTEIQDLYSALQDLVKTNVTKTPPLSSPDISKHSPGLSVRDSLKVNLEKEDIRTSTPVSGRKLSNNKSELRLSGIQNKQIKHRRGLSTGTLDAVTNIIKRSPFLTRKYSSDEVEASDNDKIKVSKKTSRSASAASGKLRKEIKSFRNSSGYENYNSSKKWNLFSRLRSKGSSGVMLDNVDLAKEKQPQDETPTIRQQQTCPTIHKHQPEEVNKTVCGACTDNVKDIDQLVAALNLEYNDNSFTGETIIPTHVTMSPQTELNKLKSWFEKAAAEAVMYHSQHNLIDGNQNVDDDNDTEENDGDDVNGQINGQRSRYRKQSGLRRPSTIRRGSSTPRLKDDKKQRKPTNTIEKYDKFRKRNNSLDHVQAVSTPNLRNRDLLNNADITICNSREIKKLAFTENKLKGSPEETRNSWKISLEDNLNRFPKTPLFYVPKDDGDEIIDNKNHKYFGTEVFYTEPKNNSDSNHSDHNSPNVKRHECESATQTKQTNAELEELNKLRPKSMFMQNYFEKHFLYDVKRLWASAVGAPDNVRNSLTLDTGIQTDDNANFCQSKIINNSHSVSQCNVTNKMQEPSMWEIRNSNTNKDTTTNTNRLPNVKSTRK